MNILNRPMRILIITMNIGKTAPGIVFARLIKGLSVMHKVDVAVNYYDQETDIGGVGMVYHIKRTRIHHSVEKLMISLFGMNLYDLWLSLRKGRSFQDKRYDLVLSCVSFQHYFGLILGDRLAKEQGVKHFSYVVDAIPPPPAWIGNDAFSRGLKRMVRKYFSRLDGLFSSNRKMLDHQLGIFQHKKGLVTDVIFNPSEGRLKHFKVPSAKTNTFVYTGGIYGPRKVDSLLEAFREFLISYPDSTLEFVGSFIPSELLEGFESGKVKVQPFTANLDACYERALALIDIDADLHNDVYLSSKVVNYLTVNRPVISITGHNSPAEILFNGVSSILQCRHDAEAIHALMVRTVHEKGKMSFEDREELIRMFELNTVVERLSGHITAAVVTDEYTIKQKAEVS